MYSIVALLCGGLMTCPPQLITNQSNVKIKITLIMCAIMKYIFNCFFIVFPVLVIWFLSSINNGVHYIEDQLKSLDNNIYEIEMHTSGLEKPNKIMERREAQKKSMEEVKKLIY